jgi:hypothetical protein
MLTKLLLSLIAALGLDVFDRALPPPSFFNVAHQEKPISFLITRRETDNFKEFSRRHSQKFSPFLFLFSPLNPSSQTQSFTFISQKPIKMRNPFYSRPVHKDISFGSVKKLSFSK